MSAVAKQAEKKVTGPDIRLPEGWVASPLGEVLTVNYGKGLKESNRISGAVPVFGSNGIVGTHNVALINGPAIVIGRKGTVGAVHFSSGPSWPIDTTYFVNEFRGLDPRFIEFAMRALTLNELDTSTAIPGLNRDDLYTQQIVLAPVAEQKRIVATINQLLAVVARAERRLGNAPKILKHFRQVVLAAACSGKLTEDWRQVNVSSEWKNTAVGELIVEKPRNGLSLKAVKYETPIRSLTLTATTFGHFDGSHFKYLDVDLPHDSHLWLKKGDILLQRGNTEEYVGVSAVYEGADNAYIYPDLMIKIRPREGVLSKFLWIALSEPKARQYFRENATGSQGSMPKINQKIVEGTIVPVPSGREQAEIVRRVEALFKLADVIEKRVAAASLRAERLTQAILAKAFRGELVPTEAELAKREGREYEPASVLLERIRRERE